LIYSNLFKNFVVSFYNGLGVALRRPEPDEGPGCSLQSAIAFHVNTSERQQSRNDRIYAAITNAPSSTQNIPTTYTINYFLALPL
jgi:hypothetical protein